MTNQIIDNEKTPAEKWQDATNKFLDESTGVIHVGANLGQERPIYANRKLPVVWIEPMPGIFEVLAGQISIHPDQVAYQYLVTDQDGAEYDFGIANNQAQSSSIFPFAQHREIWPDVDYIGSMKLKSTTLKTIIERHELNIGVLNTLIMDVQGAELLVLKGAGDYVDRFRHIRCEAADFEIYEGCCQLKDLDDYLIPRGFKRTQTWRGAGKPGVGFAYEVLYQNQNDPSSTLEVNARVAAVASVPRLGFQTHFGVAMRAFRCGDFDVPLFKFTGAFWEQHIQNAIKEMISQGVEWVITVDYDSIFDAEDVKELLTMAAMYPDADAIIPWQIKRGIEKTPLFSIVDKSGKIRRTFDPDEFNRDLTQVATGHFGLTLIKTAALKDISLPWFWSQPNPENGEWDDGRTDADIYFWRKFAEAGRKAFVANNIRIGHIEEEITWITRDFEVIRQAMNDYNKNGKPEACR